MVGAAIKGLSKILRKTGKKRPRGTPIAAGLAHRRAMLRGLSDPKKKSRLEEIKQPKAKWAKQTKAPKKKPLISKFGKGVGTGVAATLAYQEIKKGKRAETKSTKDKLQKAIDEKKKKDKEKKEAYGKRAPKKDKNYGGR